MFISKEGKLIKYHHGQIGNRRTRFVYTSKLEIYTKAFRK